MIESNTSILSTIPETFDPTAHYLFYLHGLIIEEAGIRPKSEEHGYYEYEVIVKTLANKGFTVISEARPQGTQVKPYAEKVVSQIQQLLEKQVKPANISVVGASKGGIIAAYSSSILQNREINFIFLAGLFEKCLVDAELKLFGRVLSIHDSSDKLSITPEAYFNRSEAITELKQITTELNLGHGLIYQPHNEWLDPLISWIS